MEVCECVSELTGVSFCQLYADGFVFLPILHLTFPTQNSAIYMYVNNYSKLVLLIYIMLKQGNLPHHPLYKTMQHTYTRAGHQMPSLN